MLDDHERTGLSATTPALTALMAVAALAPFNIRITTNAWTDLQLRLLVIVSLMVVLALTIRALRVRRPDRVDAVAYCWLAAIWLSALLSDDRVLGSGGAVRLSVAVLLIPAVRSVVKGPDDVRRVLQSLGLGAVVGAVIGLVTWSLGSDPDMMQTFVGKVTRLGPFNRLTRPWSHANVAAISMGASMSAVALVRDRRLRMLAMVVLVVAMVLTVSRGGLLAMTAAAVGWIVLRRDRSETKALALLALIAMATLLLTQAWTTRIDQLGDQAFYASSIEAESEFAVAGDGAMVDVTVTNESVSTWPKLGDDRVLISARWIGPDDRVWTEDWWELPRDLTPGESVTTGLSVDARLPVGSYVVRWDLIIPRTAYFGQFLGDEPVLSAVRITASRVQPDQVVAYDLVEREIGIGRIDGWRLAWRDFTSSPLLGVGPNQFAAQATSQLQAQQQSVGAHAHNIVLEPLAAWGLLGFLPFFVLGAGALVRVSKVAWRSRAVAPSAVCVGLIAVVTHGLVDWPLVTITTCIPIGILVGLAWSDT